MNLTSDQTLSALGMTGIYIAVPAWHKWVGDGGLTPRKHIKQGWSWMAMTGAFASLSAAHGLEMLQSNGVLDGDLGLWRMVGMDSFAEPEVVNQLGVDFHIREYATKRYPGCAYTHPAIEGVRTILTSLVASATDIARIDVTTSADAAVGFDEQAPSGLVDKQFNIPYQVAASVLAGEPGPDWYRLPARTAEAVDELAHRTFVSYDADCDREYAMRSNCIAKVSLALRDGRVGNARINHVSDVTEGSAIEAKFLTTAGQVLGATRARAIKKQVDEIGMASSVADLAQALRFVLPTADLGDS